MPESLELAFVRSSVKLKSSVATLPGVIAGRRRFALDGEEARDDPHALKRDAVAAARGFDEPTPGVSPAPWALSTGALEKGRDARAVALHSAREVFPEEAFDALGVAGRRIEERDPARVGPSPDRAVPDALGRVGVEHGNPRGVGAEQTRRARLLFDESSHGGEQIDRRGDAAS